MHEYLNPKTWVRETKKLFRETAAEVVIFGLIGAASLGTLKYLEEIRREIPLGFSEISQIEEIAKEQEREVEPLNWFFPTASDTVMKIFECRNESMDNANWRSTFAAELQDRIDPSMKIHRRELTDLFDEMPRNASRALQALSHFDDAQRRIQSVSTHLAKAWDDDHDHHYKTVWTICTRTTTDSEGKISTETYPCTKQEYDYTVHTYTYKPKEAQAALRELQALFRTHPSLEYSEDTILAKTTHAEGEYAAESSRGLVLEGKRLSQRELLAIANAWFKHNGFQMNYSNVRQNSLEVGMHVRELSFAGQRAKSKSYRTNSRSDSGPREYQQNVRSLAFARSFADSIGRALEGPRFVRNNITKLEQKTRAFVEAAYLHGEGNPQQLAVEVLSLSHQWYVKNFPTADGTQPARPGNVMLHALLGLATGSLLGYGLDRTGKRFGLWETNW